MKSRTSTLPRAARPPGLAARIAAWTRIARSLTFFAVGMLYLMLPMGLSQRLLLWPGTTLFPSRHPAWIGAWFRFHARTMMRIARVIAGLRLRVHGRMAPGPRVIVMNHQSVLDIPVIHAICPAPYPLIPTRTRYARGIPSISPLLRMARYPLVAQKRESVRADLEAVARAADRVAAGECSMAIFAEGHRTRDGEIGPFMKRGLLATLKRTRGVPVYGLVGDGMWGARTLAEAAYKMAGAQVDVVVLGPFQPPEDEAELSAFVDSLHARMVEALARLRRGEAA